MRLILEQAKVTEPSRLGRSSSARTSSLEAFERTPLTGLVGPVGRQRRSIQLAQHSRAAREAYGVSVRPA